MCSSIEILTTFKNIVEMRIGVFSRKTEQKIKKLYQMKDPINLLDENCKAIQQKCTKMNY